MKKGAIDLKKKEEVFDDIVTDTDEDAMHWSQVCDVKAKYECEDDSEAQEVLDSALTNEATMDQIWFAIRFHAEEDLELTEIEK